MPAITPVYGWPYQSLPDPPDGAALGQNLALAVEATVSGINGTVNTQNARITTLEANAVYRTRITLTGLAASVTFSGIPSTLRRLVVRYTTRGDAVLAQQLVQIRINGDAGANYFSEFTTAIGAGVGANSETGTTLPRVGRMAGASATAGQFSTNKIDFVAWDGPHPNYLGWVFRSFVIAGGQITEDGAGQYSGAAPYNSITFFPQSGNFVASCDFNLEGL